MFCTPTKRSNAQHLVEYQKQLLYEENKKSGNDMQQPMDSCVCSINTSSESILISHIYFWRDKHIPVEFWYTFFYPKCKSVKTREVSDLKFIPKNIGMQSLLQDIPRVLILFLEKLFLIFNQMLSIRAFGRHVLVKKINFNNTPLSGGLKLKDCVYISKMARGYHLNCYISHYHNGNICKYTF